MSKDSLGDVVYFLSEENILKANEGTEEELSTEDYCDECFQPIKLSELDKHYEDGLCGDCRDYIQNA